MVFRGSVLNVLSTFIAGIAFLGLGWAMPLVVPNAPGWALLATLVLGVALLGISLFLGIAAARAASSANSARADGGAGGNAKVSGQDSYSFGGRGGTGGLGPGGRGGDAEVMGNRSVAVGGEGGASSPPRTNPAE